MNALALGSSPDEPTADGLAAAGHALFLGMAAEDPERNRDAMRAVAPTAEDFRGLFPERHDALWQVWGPEARDLIDRAPERSGDYRGGLPILSVSIMDVRGDADLVMARSLEEVPEQTHVYGGVIRLSDGSERVARSFVFVGGRWVWLWQLERLAGLLAE